jgi:hypothetical protein
MRSPQGPMLPRLLRALPPPPLRLVRPLPLLQAL